MQSLIYVNIIGKNSEDEFVYEFYFSDEPDIAWGVDWDVRPASICNLSVPQKANYTMIKTLVTNIVLSVAQKNSCFSMQDCRDGVIPVAWEDIDGYDEYPEDGRIVLPFGIEFNDVEAVLASMNLVFNKEKDEFEF